MQHIKLGVEMEGSITVSTQVYEAKLDDSYALGKIFSHLVHVCGIGSDSEGKRPEAVVIDYIELLRKRAPADRQEHVDTLVGDMQGLAMEVCTSSKTYESIISEMTETLLGVGITEDELDTAGWGVER